MRFVALDVETANPDMSNICQIGIVHFEDGKAVDSWSTLIDPKDYFDGMNVSIHGIDEDDVRGAPDFKQASAEVRRRVANQIVAIHTAFDRKGFIEARSRCPRGRPKRLRAVGPVQEVRHRIRASQRS